ncbi:hypothetical protein HP570_10085 [Brevibacillus sp. RS1.1]|uniref:hypothetical protein n=1 Tax=Brevibacillus sp. RS1.1 TaxID=2738982 RepID=UPI00156AF5B9|nr:hypothetical protein [Brevibacillus sp. RS1.1]NRR02569.1 hypothetical protein [Brevibacillus sp. RS1.1]
MQAGRELDALVAGALKGWEPGFIEHLKENDGWILIPQYSTDWRRMGELVEEARKQDIYLDILPNETCYISETKTMSNATIGKAIKSEAPHAACLAFLEAKGLAI